jgi:hypothetical protein
LKASEAKETIVPATGMPISAIAAYPASRQTSPKSSTAAGTPSGTRSRPRGKASAHIVCRERIVAARKRSRSSVIRAKAGKRT